MTRAQPTDRPRAEFRAATLSLVIGSTLLLIKFIAYLLTGSAAIFSDAMESIVNVVAASAALYSVVLANRPPDEQHPYGHGKVEFMSAGFEGGLMLFAAGAILLRAIEQLIRGAHIEDAKIYNGIALIVAATIINGVVGVFLVRAGRHGGSITLEADGKHLLADAVTSAVVILALLAVKITGFRRIDPLAAIVIALWVALEAIRLLRRSAAGLMDEQDLADDKLLRQILDSHLAGNGAAAATEPAICSYHKLRHRHSGRYHWVDFHIMVPKVWDIERGHRVASAIEYEIEQALGEGNATAHVEPCIEPECRRCKLP